MTIIWEEQTSCYDPDEPVDFSTLYNEEGYELKELDAVDRMGLAFTLGDFMIPLCRARGKTLLQKSKIFSSPARKTQDVSPDFADKAMEELMAFEPEINLFDVWSEIRAISQYPPYNQTAYQEKLVAIYKLLNRLANYYIWMLDGRNDINVKRKLAAANSASTSMSP
jgi:hypothetical protein